MQLLEENDDVGDGPDFVWWQLLPKRHRVPAGYYRLPQVKGAYGGHAFGGQPAGDLNLARCGGRLSGARAIRTTTPPADAIWRSRRSVSVGRWSRRGRLRGTPPQVRLGSAWAK
ncbi:hypothetical protein GCM10023238_26880 [Streptomyces heliomycini]